MIYKIFFILFADTINLSVDLFGINQDSLEEYSDMDRRSKSMIAVALISAMGKQC